MDERDLNDDDGIEVEVEVEPHTEHDSDSIEEPPSKKGLGIIPVTLLFALATILGALGGAYGAQYFTPKPDISATDTKINRTIADAEDRLNNQIEGIQSELGTLRAETLQLQANQNAVSLPDESQITSLLMRVEALENSPLPRLPEIDEATLVALQQAQKDGFSWPDVSELKARLSALESEKQTLQGQVETLANSLITLSENPAPATAEPVYIVTDTSFPKQALLDAVFKQNEEKGFLSKALSKHIQVRGPNDPVALIETIETALARDDLRAALRAFDALPENIRSVGQNWREAVARARNE